jgi:hypothetical protein
MGIVIDQVAAHVVGVLRRAESLFAEPDELPRTDHLGAAVEAAIAASTAEWSGSMAAAHDTRLADAVARLQDSAGADARLAEHMHALGADHCAATKPRGGCAKTPNGSATRRARLGEWGPVVTSRCAGAAGESRRDAGVDR